MCDFGDAFATIGADFAELFPTVPVTVRQVKPDGMAALVTSDNVHALKRSRRRQPFGISGGEVGSDQCRFILKADDVGFLPKARDEVVEADGTVWRMESVSAIAFNQLYAADVTLKR